jgi:small-conductance mechanosensitive channel
MNEWVAAAIAVGAGFVVGALAAVVVRRLMSAETRPVIVRRVAEPVANLAFWIAVVVGLVTALGIVNPDSLDQLPKDAVDFLPKMIAALIVFIVGNAAATLAAGAVASAVARAGAGAQKYGPMAVRTVVLAAAVILAAGQIGIDTTIINLAAAAVLFSVGLTLALLVGLGGRSVSSEVAAARALRGVLSEGDVVTMGDVRGRVVTVHSTAVELEASGGIRHLIPNSELMAASIQIERLSPQ